jgi:RimJ/RimL family protein N-acetyltransferase
MVWIQPETLTGRLVVVEPLSDLHVEGLWRNTDPDIFRFTFDRPADSSLPAFATFIRGQLDAPGTVPFALRLGATGELVGCTAYLDMRPNHRGLEIGSTWIARAYQGSVVNPESKYLLLRRAFEVLGALRVQLKTDGRNLQSQRAIEKLGARHEGVLRKHLVLPDGYVRDTVMYSITDDEWPEVRTKLSARLGYSP